eukprot:9685558-Prorocentrum_lima.AAC.1
MISPCPLHTAVRWQKYGMHGEGKNPMQKIERIQPVPEEWKYCDNTFSAVLIRAVVEASERESARRGLGHLQYSRMCGVWECVAPGGQYELQGLITY